MLLQACITSTFVVLGGGFRKLLSFAVVAFWAFYFLTVLGAVVLRFREPGLARPYKTWLITPMTFCIVALFLLAIPALAAPQRVIAVALFVGVGVPVYFVTQRRRSTGVGREGLEEHESLVTDTAPRYGSVEGEAIKI
ncbi:hypothetical protein FA95DRAFT_1607875 [Auriscalpium vulgare]|uniref:Uncharacterized protein n=1 Tax=Auriscalpium vulgare TaxID=40419 RepID=A0ACB8RNN7_9AGAM|nr:hypothetical protein FA95DRAFT_1607875 [Auriscalpium vulgare]